MADFVRPFSRYRVSFSFHCACMSKGIALIRFVLIVDIVKISLYLPMRLRRKIADNNKKPPEILTSGLSMSSLPIYTRRSEALGNEVPLLPPLIAATP